MALYNFCEKHRGCSLFEKIDLIADNSEDRQNNGFYFEGGYKPVHSIETCLKLAAKEPLILITARDADIILRQLDNIPQLNHIDCYIYFFVSRYPPPYQLPERGHGDIKIPKTIHYCWFGGKPIPERFLEYMKTWKKFCPDYDIVRWDENNYDVKKNRYMSEAYQCKKWGFVSDYARLDIIHKHGGVYLDTDVELVRNIDYLLYDEAFCGFENINMVDFGLGFGAVPSFPLIKEVLDMYENMPFFNADGSMNLTPCPVYQTEALRRHGLKDDNSLQCIKGMKVYPYDVLSPYYYVNGVWVPTENTHSIHWYAGTWLESSHAEKQERLKHKMSSLNDRMANGKPMPY